jgi:hypothetical protein
MKTVARLLVPFFISVAALVLSEGPVHAGRVLKGNSISAQTHKNPSDRLNLLIEEVEVARSGPNPGGNSVTQSISEGLNLQLQKGPLGDSISAKTHKIPSDRPNLLIEEVEVAPSGPNPGGNSVIQSISEGLNLQFQKGPLGDSINAKTNKNPSDHSNLLIEEVEVAPSGPNPGGNSVTQSISERLNLQFQKGPLGDSISAKTHKNPSDHPNLLIEGVEVAPSGPNPGGNSVTQ